MEKDIGKIMKRDDCDIILRIDDFADKRGFTIREFVTNERYTGFTKAGVRILSKDWVKFKEMINSVDDADMIQPEVPEEEISTDEQIESHKSEETQKEELPDY